MPYTKRDVPATSEPDGGPVVIALLACALIMFAFGMSVGACLW